MSGQYHILEGGWQPIVWLYQLPGKLPFVEEQLKDLCRRYSGTPLYKGTFLETQDALAGFEEI